MNNAEQINQMLKGMGFIPYYMNDHFQKPGYGQNWQRWSVKNKVEVYRKNSDRWEVVRRTRTGWAEIYHGAGSPEVIREVLEVNGLVEKQSNPSPFWNKFPETKPTEEKLYLLFFEGLGEDVATWTGEEWDSVRELDERHQPLYWAEIPPIYFDDSITPETLRGKANEK